MRRLTLGEMKALEWALLQLARGTTSYGGADSTDSIDPRRNQHLTKAHNKLLEGIKHKDEMNRKRQQRRKGERTNGNAAL